MFNSFKKGCDTVDLDKYGLGKTLKSIRKELNLTIEEASFLAGVNEKTIYRIEHGINKVSRSTLDKLSITYKKDLFTIYNKYMSNPKIKLSNLIHNVEKYLYVDDLKNIKKCMDQLRELPLKQLTSYEEMFVKHYIKLLESTYIDLKYNDRLEAVNSLIDSIKTEIYGFEINNYNNFNYSPIEKRILMNISTMSHSFYKDEIYIELLSHLSKLSSNNKILYPKMLSNLATLYHRKGRYKKSFYIVNKGIDYCIKNNNLDILPKFFFRKFTSEVNLNMENNYKETLKKAIFMAEINNQAYLKDIFVNNAEKIYEVDVDLMQSI